MTEFGDLAFGELHDIFDAIAYIDEKGKAQTLLNAEGEKITPSTVLFDGPDVIVGKEAAKAKEKLAQRVRNSCLNARLFIKELN